MPIFYPNIPFRVGCTISNGLAINGAHSLNDANNLLALIRRVFLGGTLSQVRICIYSKTGSPLASDIKCQIYSGEDNTPATAVGTEVSLASLGSGIHIAYFDFSSQNITLNAGTRYWFVIRNANDTPSSNYVMVSYAGNLSHEDVYIDHYLFCGLATSSDGGATWVYKYTYPAALTSVLLVYSDGSAEGITLFGSATNTSSGNTMYGVRFTTPSGVKLRVVAATMYGTYSSPTDPKFAIYSPSGLLAEAPIIDIGGSGGRTLLGSFSSVVTLEPETTYKLVQKCSSGSVSFYVANNMDSSSEQLSVFPMSSRMVQTTDGGSTWTDVNNKYPLSWWLLLDPDQPIESGGGFPFPMSFRGMV